MTKSFSRMLKIGQTSQRKNPHKTNENTKDHVCHNWKPRPLHQFLCTLGLEKKRITSEKARVTDTDKDIPSNRRMVTQEANLSMNKAFAAMGNSSEEEFNDEELENKSLFAIEQIDEYDFLALVSIESEEEKNISYIMKPSKLSWQDQILKRMNKKTYIA